MLRQEASRAHLNHLTYSPACLQQNNSSVVSLGGVIFVVLLLVRIYSGQASGPVLQWVYTSTAQH